MSSDPNSLRLSPSIDGEYTNTYVRIIHASAATAQPAITRACKLQLRLPKVFSRLSCCWQFELLLRLSARLHRRFTKASLLPLSLSLSYSHAASRNFQSINEQVSAEFRNSAVAPAPPPREYPSPVPLYLTLLFNAHPHFLYIHNKTRRATPAVHLRRGKGSVIHTLRVCVCVCIYKRTHTPQTSNQTLTFCRGEGWVRMRDGEVV